MPDSPLAPDAARLLNAAELRALADTAARERATSASGLWGSSVAAAAAAIRGQTGRPVLVVCGHLDEADDLADDLELFVGGERPCVLPAVEVSSALGRASEETVANRLRLVARVADAKRPQPDIVAPVQALVQPVPAKQDLAHLTKRLGPGDDLEPEKLIVWLSEHGYSRVDQCEVPGDFAVRGGIVDVYVPGQRAAGEASGLPVRVDFFGDEVESVRGFDPDTLGSGDPLGEVELIDILGKPSGSSTALPYLLHDDTIVLLWAPLEIAEQAKSYLDRVADARGMYPLGALVKSFGRLTCVELSPFETSAGGPSLLTAAEPTRVSLPIRSAQRFQTETKAALKELAEASTDGHVSVFCDNDGERQRFRELLVEHQPEAAGRVRVELGYLHRAFVWDGDGGPILLIGHHELFGRYDVRRRTSAVPKNRITAKAIDSFVDLAVGDYVVHVAHGIAKFTGINTIEKGGKSEEFLTLRFDGGATLHVPASRINLVQKYVGGFDGHPRLSTLGSGAWERQKEKVGEAILDMASELIEVQAARRGLQGTAFPADTPWQHEFEAEFPFTPTVDQLTCATQIKGDMQQPRPMDRLLCGDVGYGKTELAMRAAFKAIESGRQVAVLVPTTILAEQHERSFRERFANYPFHVESVSRFKTGKKAKDILGRLHKGEVDVIVGTHRLLSKDIKFKDLGLVVIDEEQRFGVTHKERLKQLRTQVDVLTMSATPIPRTLHMGLVGLRDISSLTTAPQDRRSIVTEVTAYDANRVKLAVQRELAREGQVYFVHNRVGDIFEVADNLQKLVPDARIVVGHGQMDEGELEDVMLKFIRHEADVLVATTIIESGLDIPNANTMLIDNADQFGLSQLHQLRGRVGRYKHRAYCYLLLPADRPVTPVAAKRLKAIEEYSHLGAGFKIAMRDLELRGAGNILGSAQSGHIAAVGYELYCQLLEEAVEQLKHGKKQARPEAHVDLGTSAYIPKTYIAADKQRMDFYRRLTRCTSVEEVRQVEQDMTDAFGAAQRPVLVLVAQIELRLLAAIYGIDSIVTKAPDIVLKVADATKAERALTGAPGRLTPVDDRTVYLRMPPTFTEPEAALLTLRNLLKKAYERDGPPTVAAVNAEPAAA